MIEIIRNVYKYDMIIKENNKILISENGTHTIPELFGDIEFLNISNKRQMYEAFLEQKPLYFASTKEDFKNKYPELFI